MVHEVTEKQIPTNKIIAQTIFFISDSAVFILSPAVLLILLFPYSIYGFSGISAHAMNSKDMPTKKAWHLFAFIGTFEVLDYLILPITTSKAHAYWRERRCFTQGELSESVQVSKVPE
ncbi:MAG: hypothetical protein K6A94_10705 [Bacteroidales bacterium]|nr:hypothetical protein [Bacteroidales bacterium]